MPFLSLFTWLLPLPGSFYLQLLPFPEWRSRMLHSTLAVPYQRSRFSVDSVSLTLNLEDIIINTLGLASTERKAFYGSDPCNHQRLPLLLLAQACRDPTLCNWTRVQAARAPDEDSLRSDPGRSKMLYIVNIFRFYIKAL
jgi:hypothetical protein